MLNRNQGSEQKTNNSCRIVQVRRCARTKMKEEELETSPTASPELSSGSWAPQKPTSGTPTRHGRYPHAGRTSLGPEKWILMCFNLIHTTSAYLKSGDQPRSGLMLFITLESRQLSKVQSVHFWRSCHRGVQTEPGYASPPAVPSAEQVPFDEMISRGAPPAGHCRRGTESTTANCD